MESIEIDPMNTLDLFHDGHAKLSGTSTQKPSEIDGVNRMEGNNNEPTLAMHLSELSAEKRQFQKTR